MNQRSDIEMFLQQVLFFGFFFVVLLMIASFGIIAEA